MLDIKAMQALHMWTTQKQHTQEWYSFGMKKKTPINEIIYTKPASENDFIDNKKRLNEAGCPTLAKAYADEWDKYFKREKFELKNK
jgi:hypothetical protein